MRITLNHESEICANCDKAVGYNAQTWRSRIEDVIYETDIDPETEVKIGMIQGYTNCGYNCPYNVPKDLGVLD